MMTKEIHHIEIEHKFLFSSEKDFFSLKEAVKKNHPEKIEKLNTRETYFKNKDEHFVLRHKFDPNYEELSWKEIKEDNEKRKEWTLVLDHREGSQLESVHEILKTLGVEKIFSFQKELEAFIFVDAEIVFYQAYDSQYLFYCLEIEAKNCKSENEGLLILKKYEEILKLDPKNRCKKSLYHLFLE